MGDAILYKFHNNPYLPNKDEPLTKETRPLRPYLFKNGQDLPDIFRVGFSVTGDAFASSDVDSNVTIILLFIK